MNRIQVSAHVALACLLFLSALLTPLPLKAQSVASTDLFFNEVQTVHLITLERRSAGLPPLRWNQELTHSARDFAQDVVLNQPLGYCGHTDSEGRSPGERMRIAGFVRLGAWAENSVCGYTTPEVTVRAWMNSDAHRANLLDGRFREIGVGFALSEANRGYIVADITIDSGYAPIIIENEAPSTTSTQVQLYIYDQVTQSGFMGQEASVEMMISNDPGFGGAVWQPFQAETTWTLSSGEGWKTVYVKTRDGLGRTVVAADTIYLGVSLPSAELSFGGASQFGTGFRLEKIEAGDWPQIQFSLDWVGDDSDPSFAASTGASTTLEDAGAVGGTAVSLQSGAIALLWTGGYLASTPGIAYFRVKVTDNSSTQDVLRLRVLSATGEAGQRLVRGVDFSAANAYQEFAVPYDLGASATTITFRIDSLVDAGVVFDAVTLFTAPIPVAAPLQWLSPENYLRNCGVQARFVKDDGSFSPIVEVHPASGVLTVDAENVRAEPQLLVTPPSVLIETTADQPSAPIVQLSVQCANCGEGPWQAVAGETWIQLAATNDAIEIQVNPEGMVPGVYQGQVVISAPDGTGLPPVVVPVTVMLGDATTILSQKLYLPAVRR